MLVNGFRLPSAFVDAVSRTDAGAPLMLREEVDAYGNQFGMTALELLSDPTAITEETARLSEDFRSENNADYLFADSDGLVPWIEDFSKIVCFGHMGERDPVCFDFRNDPEDPSVIYWADAYWRRLAPSFQAFLDLFEPFDIDRWIELGLASLGDAPQAWG